MNTVYLLLGSNLGNSRDIFEEAIHLLKENIGYISKCSSLYESPPWGFDHENNFINQALGITTDLVPLEVLNRCLSIERKLGRTRTNSETYQARVIDIDILLFNSESIEEENLIIPHEHLHTRRFALLPLNEIASEQIHPKFNNTIEQLLYSCSDNSKVSKV